MMTDLPNLVTKKDENCSNDHTSSSGAPLSIDTLKTILAADLDKIEKTYELIVVKCEEIMTLKNELADLKLERGVYSDLCKSLGRETLKLKEIIAQQQKEIGSLKARSLKQTQVKYITERKYKNRSCHQC